MQAKEREEQLRILSNSYIQLKADFEYNVQLLDGRDAELMQRDAELSERDAQLAECDAQLAQAQTKLCEQLALQKHLQEQLAKAHEGVQLGFRVSVQHKS